MSAARFKFSILVCLVGVPLAQAQYKVTGHATGWSIAEYNMGGYTGGHIYLPSFGNPSASVTNDTTGTATGIFANVAGAGGPNGPNGHIATYDQLGMTADLASVTETMSESDTGINNGYAAYDGGATSSELQDSLTFNVAGANSGTVTTISYTQILRGTLGLSGSNQDGNVSGEVQSVLNLNGLGVGGSVDIQLSAASGYTQFINGQTGSGVFTTDQPDLIIRQGTFTIMGSSKSCTFDMQLNSEAYNGMIENYSQSFSFSLPSGVTIQSSSGVFGSAAPEPSALLALGAFGLLGFRRRR